MDTAVSVFKCNPFLNSKRVYRVCIPILLFLLSASGLMAKGYVAVYPRSKSFSPADRLHLSVFSRGGNTVRLYVSGISRKDFEKYNLDPWSRSFQEKVKDVRFAKTGAKFNRSYKIKDGANYFHLRHSLDAGYYMLLAELNDGTRAYSTLLISNLGIVAKQSESSLLVYTVNLKTGKPFPRVNLNINSPGINKKLSLKSGRDGRISISLAKSGLNPDRINISGVKGDEVAQVFSGRTPYQDSRYNIFVDTDRPVYKSGHLVNWFAIVRRKGKTGWVTPGRNKFTYRILDTRGNVIKKGRGRLDSFGKTYGKFRIPGGQGGFFTVMLELGGESHQANLLVKDYVKPTMMVKVLPDQGSIVYGDPVAGKIKAKFLHGGAPEGAKVEYTVYKGYYRAPAFSITSEERFF